jgi:hypothetical protein
METLTQTTNRMEMLSRQQNDLLKQQNELLRVIATNTASTTGILSVVTGSYPDGTRFLRVGEYK